MNPGRNDPCPCGSGKKYKKCCTGKLDSSQSLPLRQRGPVAGARKSGPSPDELHQLVAMFGAGHHAELESRARMLLERYPEAGFVWKVLGVMLQMQGRDSLLALRKAAELLPGDHETHYNLGNSFYQQGMIKAATDLAMAVEFLKQSVDHFDKALVMNKKDEDAQFNRELAAKELKLLEEELEKQKKELERKLKRKRAAKKGARKRKKKHEEIIERLDRAK